MRSLNCTIQAGITLYPGTCCLNFIVWLYALITKICYHFPSLLGNSQRAFLEVQALISKSVPAVVSAFFPELLIGIKFLSVGSSQVCVTLEDVTVCMC